MNNADRILTIPGDGSVPTSSSVIPGLKWAQDFIEQESSNQKSKNKTAYPVNFIEVCGVNRNRHEINDEDNLYLGLDCDCKRGLFSKDGSDCNHSGFVRDQKMIEFMARSFVKDGAIKRLHAGKKGKFAKFSVTEWNEYTDKCKMSLGDLFVKK